MTSTAVRLAALWTLDPPQAVRIVIRALTDADGNVWEASQRLGIGYSTLHRRISSHKEIRRALDKILEERRK